MAKAKKNRLTPKQSAFIREYLVDLNSRQAAIRAGYSKRTATEIGHENLRKPHIAEAIQKAQEERAKRTEITQDKVLQNIVRIGDKAESADRYGEALKAQELLGKHVKLFTESIDVNLKTPPVLKIEFIRSKNANRKTA